MLDLTEMRNKAEERGYTLHHKTGDCKRYNFINNDGIGLIVYPESDEFEIYYNIDLCTSIQGGKCGSFMNDKHFNLHESKISKYANILRFHCN